MEAVAFKSRRPDSNGEPNGSPFFVGTPGIGAVAQTCRPRRYGTLARIMSRFISTK